MYAIHDDLRAAYAGRGILPTARYEELIGETVSSAALAYNSPLMWGTARTIFGSPSLVAYNLLQNAIDEAKGAARISVIAERHAAGPLRAAMRRHIAEELKHSHQFLRLVELTDYRPTIRPADAAAVQKVLDFEDGLSSFLCRVHSIEIRSWTMLRIYIALAEEVPSLRAAVPVLRDILEDEIGHVLYTGEYVMEQLERDPGFITTARECLSHTNRETWKDLAGMTGYLADNFDTVLVRRDQPPAGASVERSAMSSPLPSATRVTANTGSDSSAALSGSVS